MRVCVTTEQRFTQTPDGAIWTPSAFPFSFWQRYFEGVFDHVRVIARVVQASEPPESGRRADGDRVTFAAIPMYVGPFQYLKRWVAVHRAIREAIGESDAIILRVGSQIASCVELALDPNRPFAVEVVTDPYNIFAPGSVSHPFRSFFRVQQTSQLQRQCRKACAAGYVTERFLQQRYPPGAATYSTAYAATELTSEAFAQVPRSFKNGSRPVRIVTVGSLAQMYKGVDILINAVAICVDEGLDVQLVVVGDGRYREALERIAEERGIAARVVFRGAVPSGAGVREQLDDADVFALVSRTEGLPGAMIEAMARALPCIGTPVGGIPELLSRDCLVPPNDAAALACKIREMVTHPDRMARLSSINLARAYAYSEASLLPKRRQLLVHVRAATEHWLDEGQARGNTSYRPAERLG